MNERERSRGRGRERRLSRTEVEGRVSSARRTERPALMRETPGRSRRDDEREGRDSRDSREGPRARARSSRPPSTRSPRPAPRREGPSVDEKSEETNGSTHPPRRS